MGPDYKTTEGKQSITSAGKKRKPSIDVRHHSKQRSGGIPNKNQDRRYSTEAANTPHAQNIVN